MEQTCRQIVDIKILDFTLYDIHIVVLVTLTTTNTKHMQSLCVWNKNDRILSYLNTHKSQK
jgi:hypothetical protein